MSLDIPNVYQARRRLANLKTLVQLKSDLNFEKLCSELVQLYENLLTMYSYNNFEHIVYLTTSLLFKEKEVEIHFNGYIR
jgi:hypothetical protein